MNLSTNHNNPSRSTLRFTQLSAAARGKLPVFLFFVLFTALSFRCDYPYSPKPAIQPGTEIKNVTLDAGTVYVVNGDRQICNPSIAPGGAYDGCMLWLNFGGELNVKVPEAMAGYATDRANVKQHDRLTVSDTSNTVRWFIMRQDLGVTGQLQDPEWSTASDYVICLGDDKNDDHWGSHVVRLSDKAHLKISNDNMIETSTPHLWVAPAATGANSSSSPSYPSNSGGFADSATVRNFFGTDNVVIAYSAESNGSLTLRFIDYRAKDPVPVQLRKPEGRSDWDTESPLISPDGRWILFNCFSQGVYESYVQRLDKEANPLLVAKNAVDPHWWVHAEFKTTYIVYAALKGDYFTKEDYTDAAVTGTIGATMKQEIRIASDKLPAHAAFSLVGEPSMIVNLPFKGGMSHNGKYLCTGYGLGFIISLF